MKYYIAQASWEPYDTGKKKPPVVPEPSFYGFVFIGLTLCFLFIKKYKK